MKKQSALLLVIMLMVTGCYHTRVETGLTPGTEVIDKPWAHSFINGLVPPATVDAAAECTSGVAVVETELSFLNMLAAGVTLGIYSPMHIKVTCAATASSMFLDDDQQQVHVDAGADQGQMAQAFETAAEQALQTQQPVYVRLR